MTPQQEVEMRREYDRLARDFDAAMERMRQLEEIVRVVAAISEHGRGNPGEPYDAQVSLLTITKARKLLETG